MSLIYYDLGQMSPQSTDVTGALQATTDAAVADFDGTVQNPITGALVATTAGSTADFDGIEAMQGALQATTAPAQADLDAIESMQGALQAQTAAAQADLDGVVLSPVTGALQANTGDATADFNGIAGEDVQPNRGAMVPDWRERLEKALKAEEKPKPKTRTKKKLALTIHALGKPALARFRGTVETRGRLASTGSAALVHVEGRVKVSRRARAIAREARAPEAVAEAPLAVERRDRRRDSEMRAAVEATDSRDFRDFDEALLDI